MVFRKSSMLRLSASEISRLLPPLSTVQLEPANLDLIGGDVTSTDESVVFTPLALTVGLGCLLAQCILYIFFRSNGFSLLPKSNTWSAAPSYTAHQVIVFPLMVYLVWKGTIEWFFGNHTNDSTAQDRIVQGSYFSDSVLGIMTWDIPITILTPKLRNWPMIIHHVAMVVTAALSLGVWSQGTRLFGYYAPFYFGLTEVSTLPLVVMDLMKTNNRVAPDWLGPLFAFLFLTVRALYFPYVSVASVLPDIRQAARKGIYRSSLYSMAVLNILFTLLQLYWGSLVVKELVKLVQNGAL